MNETRKSFWVGLFVLCGLVALAALIVMFGQTGYWTRSAGYVIRVKLPYAAGVRAGTVVTIAGLPVGRVTQVDFADPERPGEGVVADVAFDDPRRRLHKGAHAFTNEPGLGEGRPPIQLDPGPADAPLLASGELIDGTITSAVESLVPKEIVQQLESTAAKISTAADALTPVLHDLHTVLQPRTPAEVDRAGGPPGNLASAMTRLDAALKHFNDVLGDPKVKDELRASVDNLYTMTNDGKVVMKNLNETTGTIRVAAEDAHQLIGKASDSIDRIDGHVDALSRRLMTDFDLASSVLTRMDRTLLGVEQGQGTLGRLFKDPKLYDALVLTFRRLAAAAEDFRMLVKEWQKGKIRVGL